MSRIRRIALVTAVALALSLPLGCQRPTGDSSEPAPRTSQGPTSAQEEQAPRDPGAAPTLAVRKADGSAVFRVALPADSIAVHVGGRVLRARGLGAAKHVYQSGEGDPVLTVKRRADGLKLVAPDGDTLLAKVKRKEAGRLKISDNVENAHALQIRPEGPNLATVTRDGAALGRVVFRPDGGGTRVQDASGRTVFEASSARPWLGLGVLLDDRVAPNARFVIAAELASDTLR